MSKITLTFDLPDDYDIALIALKAGEVIVGIDDFRQFLRTEIKHGEYSDKEYELLEKIRDKFNEAFNGIN
jgi:hypothetical protein